MPRYMKKVSYDELLERTGKEEKDWTRALFEIPNDDFKVELSGKLTIEEPISVNDSYASLCYVENEFGEAPVFFFMYIDEKDRTRAYIPKDGNTYNPWTLTAFGNERIHDSKLCINNMPEKYFEEDTEKGGYKETSVYKEEFGDGKVKKWIDKEKMKNEFMKYIQTRTDL